MGFLGKLIAIEGIDGSGKRTQIELLEKALAARGHLVYSTGFPQYDGWFGRMIGKFLNGEFGALDQVDPHFSAMLYAGDRFESKSRLVAALELGKTVLTDRYIASNLAHQVARVPAEKRAEFTAWIEHLEYRIYGLPKEDLVLHLRVPAPEAQILIQRKSVRSYTLATHDLQEADLRHLQGAAAMYDSLAQRLGWKTIECFSEARGAMRAPEAISADVLTAIEPFLTTGESSRHSGKGRS
jgi:dTMP kinase